MDGRSGAPGDILLQRCEAELVQRFQDVIRDTRSTFQASFFIGNKL